MNKNKEKTIFFSYSYKDTEIVDEIDKDFQGFPGISIKRCVRDIGYTDSIKEFMKKVRETDFVFIVVSDAFIKSCNCMYEVTELFKENDFKKRILPIVPYEGNDERRAKIFNPEDRAEVVSNWSKRRDELENKIKNIPRESTNKLDEDLKRYREICNIVDEFINTIADMNYVPLNQMKNERYKQILEKIGYNETDIESELLLIRVLDDKEDREIELDKFINKYPKYFGGYFQKGYIALEEKKYKIGIYFYTKAIQLKPDYEKTYYNRSLAYHNLKKYNDAIADYTRVIKLNSNHFNSYNNRGHEYMSLYKYNEAISDFTKAINLKPDFAEAYYNRGISYSRLQKFSNAIADFTKTIELQPNIEKAYYNRGFLYNNLEKYTEAVEDYKKAIELKSNNVNAYNNLGYSYLDIKNYNNAEINFNKCLEFDNKHFDAMIGLSILYFENKNKEETKNWINKAIEIESRLNEGMKGIEKLEKEGWFYSKDNKEILKKVFDLLGK